MQLGARPPSPDGVVERMTRGADVVHVPDAFEGEAYRSGTLVREVIGQERYAHDIWVLLCGTRTRCWALFSSPVER